MAVLLIVEDDTATNEAICEYMSSAGHTTLSAFDGEQGLQIAREKSIDLVVLDIMLPKRTGLEVLKELRQTSGIPVLMLTALDDEPTQAASFDEQADDDITVDFGGYTASGPGGPIDLTPKEIDLLKLLIEHKGLVLTRSQILDELWGYDYPIIDRTIDTYIKNLRKKLSLDRIVTVKGVGYKYEEHP